MSSVDLFEEDYGDVEAQMTLPQAYAEPAPKPVRLGVNRARVARAVRRHKLHTIRSIRERWNCRCLCTRGISRCVVMIIIAALICAIGVVLSSIATSIRHHPAGYGETTADWLRYFDGDGDDAPRPLDPPGDYTYVRGCILLTSVYPNSTEELTATVEQLRSGLSFDRRCGNQTECLDFEEEPHPIHIQRLVIGLIEEVCADGIDNDCDGIVDNDRACIATTTTTTHASTATELFK
jgi:hypothetical protein